MYVLVEIQIYKWKLLLSPCGINLPEMIILHKHQTQRRTESFAILTSILLKF